MAYQVIYQAFLPASVVKKSGRIKMHRKDGTTRTVPKKYQIFRFPHRLLSLSDKKPTIGVVTPAAI